MVEKASPFSCFRKQTQKIVVFLGNEVSLFTSGKMVGGGICGNMIFLRSVVTIKYKCVSRFIYMYITHIRN